MNIVRGTKAAILRHKYKSLFFSFVTLYCGYKGFTLYRSVKSQFSEMDSMLREAGGGAEEDQGIFGTIKNLLNNLDQDQDENPDEVDDSLIAIIANVRTAQNKGFLIKALEEDLKVPELQRRSKSSAKDVKLKAWKDLQHVTLTESFLFNHASELFLALSLVGYSLTGRGLFKLTSESMQGELLKTFSLFGGEEEAKTTAESEAEE